MVKSYPYRVRYRMCYKCQRYLIEHFLTLNIYRGGSWNWKFHAMFFMEKSSRTKRTRFDTVAIFFRFRWLRNEQQFRESCSSGWSDWLSMTLPFLPPEFRIKLDFFYLVMFFNSLDRKILGHHLTLRPLINELKNLLNSSLLVHAADFVSEQKLIQKQLARKTIFCFEINWNTTKR